MRRSEVRIGDMIEHDRTGDYLGRVTARGPALVYFDGPRRRDGRPVNFAGYGEVRKVVEVDPS